MAEGTDMGLYGANMKHLMGIITAHDKGVELIDQGADGIAGYINFHGKGRMRFIFSWGGGWEHLSVSWPGQSPTWEEMCYVKTLFWTPEECCVQYHPPESDYINNHPYCLHIWRPIYAELPMPPKEMVGI
jgi:hypothetical protein